MRRRIEFAIKNIKFVPLYLIFEVGRNVFIPHKKYYSKSKYYTICGNLYLTVFNLQNMKLQKSTERFAFNGFLPRGLLTVLYRTI